MDNVAYWLEEISSAKRREKEFRKDGQNIINIYENEVDTPFNILYSNTETLLPALFSETPKPVISRRFKDDDPMGKIISDVSQRMLEYLIDTDIDEYDNFTDSVKAAVLDGLLPGRGVTSIKYEANIDEENESVSAETVCTDTRTWNRVYFGYAKKWSKVPWVAYEEHLDKDEASKLFDDISEIQFTAGEQTEDEEDASKAFDEDERNVGKRKTALFYQIWCKKDKKIKYVCPQDKDKFMKVEDDPLELTGFFNCPEPIRFVQKPSNLTPTALYDLYENQAKELNEIQKRLNRVIKAIKVRGLYDSGLGDEIETILKEDDNALIPTDRAGSLAAEGGLDKAIWFLPFGELIAVAQQLYQARESCKQVIYEITGISDIVRGQSMASETLGAQKIKEQWGTMRLKQHQKEVQRYVLDLMKIMLDVAINSFSAETWKAMTMLPYPMAQEKQKAQQTLQNQQQAIKEQNRIAQLNGQPPMQPPPPDPKLVQMAQMPSWEDILEILKDDYTRSYKMDMETNSTLDVEATEDKQLVGEFMNALAQFMNGVSPMVESGTMSFEAAKTMLLAMVRRYRFGKEVEDELKKMQPPKPKQTPEMQKQAQELQKGQKKVAEDQQKLEQDFQKKTNEIQMKEAELRHKEQMAAQEQRHREQMAAKAIEMQKQSVDANVKQMFDKQKSDLQSMLDKQAARMEKSSLKAV